STGEAAKKEKLQRKAQRGRFPSERAFSKADETTTIIVPTPIVADHHHWQFSTNSRGSPSETKVANRGVDGRTIRSIYSQANRRLDCDPGRDWIGCSGSWRV